MQHQAIVIRLTKKAYALDVITNLFYVTKLNF